MSDFQNITEEDIKKLDEVEKRWKDNDKVVCSSCIYRALRYMYDNCDEDIVHIDEGDSFTYANAGQDIHTLLDIIRKICA
jgi:hypothetical protein